MYKLISSTLYLMDLSRRSLKKIFTLRRRRQKVKTQRQIYKSSVVNGEETVAVN